MSNYIFPLYENISERNDPDAKGVEQLEVRRGAVNGIRSYQYYCNGYPCSFTFFSVMALEQNDFGPNTISVWP